MKTIEAAAKEWSRGGELSSSEKEIATNSFLEGIAFAEEWISVEAELPEFDKNKLGRGEQELYLVKVSIGSISCKTTYKVSFLINDYRWNGEGDWCYVTHWRPINRK